MSLQSPSEILAFIQEYAPFKTLPSSALLQVSEAATIQEIPAGSYIYHQDTSPIKELSIIFQGQVEKFFLRADGSKDHPEVFTVGQSMGAMSILLHNERAVRTVFANTDTVLIQIPVEQFRQLIETYPEFYAYFSQEFGLRMLSHGYADHLLRKPDETVGFQASDLAFNQRVRHLYLTDYGACTSDTTIQAAAQQMVQQRKSFLVIQDEDQKPIGIVTDQHFRARVVAKGLDTQRPITRIMDAPMQRISVEAYSFEAILKMFRLKVNHLLVEDNGQVLGMVTLGKLLNAQGKTPFIFVQSIQHEEEVRGLKKKWEQVPAMVDHLIQRGMRPEIVNQIISAVADAITNNIVRRALKELGPNPVPFSFMALGSEGRKEQTLKTDQDNAIIYKDGPADQAEVLHSYFLKLGTRIADELHAAGFAYCEGDLMAKNPRWTQPLSQWKTYYTDWISMPMDQNAVIGGTFFDCRSVFGEKKLLADLRVHMFGELDKGGSAFLGRLGQAAVVNKVPLRFFGGFQETKDADRRGIQIKRAMQTITDFGRLFALRERILFTNTGDRLEALREKGILTGQEYQEMHQAYYFMMRLRLSHQTQQILDGNSPDNLLSTNELSKIERVTLREIFKRIEQYQKRINLAFLGTING